MPLLDTQISAICKFLRSLKSIWLICEAGAKLDPVIIYLEEYRYYGTDFAQCKQQQGDV